MTNLKYHKTKYPGVRYREHEARRHGVQKDKYYFIRYQHDGKRREEGLGWTSNGWTAEKASRELGKLKEAHTKGEGPATLAEKRALDQERREKERQEKARQEKENLTFGQFFKVSYYPIAKTSKKPISYNKEHEHFNNWLGPVLGDLPLSKITPFHIEKLKKKMLDAGRAPRTIQHVYSTFRLIWNMARRNKIVFDETPTKQSKIPKIDNKRLRFLTHEEAEKLLVNLSVRSQQLHDISLLSLHTGMRAGEIFSLTWGNVDFDRGLITIVDPKATNTRTAFMTTQVKSMFNRLYGNGKNKNDLIFKDTNGERIAQVSSCFARAVIDLKFNEGVSDPRHKVVFHTLRHTYASWLVEGGTDLYRVSKLIGHSTTSMTERYAHLAQDTLQNEVKNLEKSITQAAVAARATEQEKLKGSGNELRKA